jgi:hypothetical protein
MTGSSFDGEALNAARLANRLLQDSGLTWEQVLEPALDSVVTAAARQLLDENEALRSTNEELEEQVRRLRARTMQLPQSWRLPSNTEQQISQAIEWTAVLTDWEREFAVSIAGRWRLTQKQQTRLDQITRKIEQIARAKGIAP